MASDGGTYLFQTYNQRKLHLKIGKETALLKVFLENDMQPYSCIRICPREEDVITVLHMF